MQRKRPPRLESSNYAGRRRYFLTFCTNQRAPLLSRPSVTESVIRQLRKCSDQYGFAVTAYCFMPDHAHLLVEGVASDSNLEEFVRVWKQCTAFHARREGAGVLWQRGYYEHILRSDESMVIKAAYVLTNPVRAGLARSPHEYQWSGSFVTTVDDLLERAQMVRGSRGPTLRNVGM
jgi:putative transposase